VNHINGLQTIKSSDKKKKTSFKEALVNHVNDL